MKHNTCILRNKVSKAWFFFFDGFQSNQIIPYHPRINIISETWCWIHSSASPPQIDSCLPSLAPGFNLWAGLTWHCVGIFIASLLVNSLNYTILPRVPAQSSWMLHLQSACINNDSSQEGLYDDQQTLPGTSHILAVGCLCDSVERQPSFLEN